MDDLISRQAAIDLLKKWSDGYSYIEVETNSAIKAFEEMPSAQPERKKGRWLLDNNCYYEIRYMCSECKLPFHVETIMMKPSWRFCPNCGAIMDGEANE